MTDELIVSLLAYVINSALLSSFIIPQAQKLKEIKDSLVKYRITYVPGSGTSGNELRELQEKQTEDVKKLQDQLDVYAIRSKELKTLVNWFWIALAVALLAILGVSVYPEHKGVILILHAIGQIGVLCVGIGVYAVSPDRMKDIGYLVNELDINPHTLVSALGLTLTLDAKGGFFAKDRKREDALILNLFPKIRVWGFRFLLVVSNKEGDVFFVSYGPIHSKTAMFRHLTAPGGWLGGEEYNRIEVGHCQFNLIEKKQELIIELMVFLPFYKHERSTPFLMTGHHGVYGTESTTYTVGSTLGMSSLSSAERYRDVECRGVGADMKITLREDAKDNVLNKVVKKYGRAIETAQAIKEHQSVDGKLLG